jgi:hypothetical protein
MIKSYITAMAGLATALGHGNADELTYTGRALKGYGSECLSLGGSRKQGVSPRYLSPM